MAQESYTLHNKYYLECFFFCALMINSKNFKWCRHVYRKAYEKTTVGGYIILYITFLNPF